MNFLALRLHRRLGSTLAVVCLALALCTPAQAARAPRRDVKPHPAIPAKPAARPGVKAPCAPVGAAGMVVAIDPETGALVRPTAEQMRALTAAERTGLMRTSGGLTEVRLPGGAVMVDLQGRFMEYSLMRLDPAGRPQLYCVDDESALLALLTRSLPASTPACEEK